MFAGRSLHQKEFTRRCFRSMVQGLVYFDDDVAALAGPVGLKPDCFLLGYVQTFASRG